MDKTAAQIADVAINNSEAMRFALRRKVAQVKVSEEEEYLNLPSVLGLGVGGGALGGAAYGALENIGSLPKMYEMSKRLPELEKTRRDIEKQTGAKTRKELMNILRNKPPVAMDQYHQIRQALGRAPDVKTQEEIVKALNKQPHTTMDDYFRSRKAIEAATSERSRTAKMLKALKGKLGKQVFKRGLLGAGLGTGAGLLGATALGHFD